MKKKLLAMLLLAAMVLSMVACGGSTTKTESTTAPAESGAEVSAAPEAAKEEAKGDPAKLHLIMYGDMGPRREEFFKNEFKQAVLDGLNIDIEVEFVGWGSDGDVQNRLMAGESFAYMHIPTNDDQAQRGLCAIISEDDINALMPEYLAMRGSKGFDCVKYKGDIVAVPMGNKAVSANNKAITVHNEILNDVGLDCKDIKTYDDLLNAAQAIKDKYPSMRIFGGCGPVMYAVENLLAGDVISGGGGVDGLNDYIYILEGEEGDQVHSTYESEAFERRVKMSQELYERGFVGGDLLSDPGATNNDWFTGNCFASNGVPGNMIEAGVKSKMAPNTDLRLVELSGLPHYYNKDYDWAISISASAQKDVPDYLRLFNWIYASEDNYNFCIYGVEGKDWEKNDNGSINALIGEKMFDDWFLQASCYMHYDSSISAEAIAEYEAWDEGSQKSKIAGFIFDNSSVSTEKAAMDAIKSEFIMPLIHGYGDYDKDMPGIIEKLKAAGLDKYIEEYQRQYSAWYAENHK